MLSYPLAGDRQQMLLAVYDGHGSQGELVSEFISFEMVEALESDAKLLSEDPAAALRKAVGMADAKLREVMSNVAMGSGARRRPPPAQVATRARSAPARAAARLAGSTLIAAILRPDRVWVACVGDSRCVRGVAKASGAGWVADDLSVDQKPDLEEEAERILAHGGRLVEDKEIGLTRAVAPDGRGLAMSRSIGDTGFDRIGVSSEPVVSVHEVSASDRCLILASDGVFEFLSSQKAVDVCYNNADNAVKASKALIALSTYKWARAEGDYRDDITAIVIFLPILERLAELDTGSKLSEGALAVYDTVGKTKLREPSVDQTEAAIASGETRLSNVTVELRSGEGRPLGASGDPPQAAPALYEETPVLRRRNLDKRRLSLTHGEAEFTGEQLAALATGLAAQGINLSPGALRAANTVPGGAFCDGGAGGAFADTAPSRPAT